MSGSRLDREASELAAGTAHAMLAHEAAKGVEERLRMLDDLRALELVGGLVTETRRVVKHLAQACTSSAGRLGMGTWNFDHVVETHSLQAPTEPSGGHEGGKKVSDGS